MSNTQLRELESNIARNKAIIAKGAALERLKNNADFQRVVATGYLEVEAVRLVHLKGSMHMQKPNHQLDIAADIDAIGRFANYLNLVSMAAAQAASSLSDDEATLEEIAAEEAGQ